MITVEMPERVKALPRDARGYPVLFTARIKPDGTPDFRTSDARKRILCADKRLCGICGQELGYYIYFIGGPLSAKHRAFGDPPMHKECAEFSAAVCPYIATAAERRQNDEQVVQPTGGVLEKPEKFCLYETRSYKKTNETIDFAFIAAPALSIVWKDMRRKGSSQ